MPGNPPLENLEETLKDAVKRIRSGRLQNEAQVKQSVIVPILRGLDWDDTAPWEFVPEFPVDNGRVDYALCGRNHRPMVFVEAKRLGGANYSSSEEQLFRYAAHKGVPLLILTDGSIWNFYLSMAQGVPADRRFYRMELEREDKAPEYAKFLDGHLHKDRVFTGEARCNAEKLLADTKAREQTHSAIPNVWQSLLESADETLRDRLAEAVELDCRIRPKLGDVEEFLRTQSSSTKQQQPALVTPVSPDRPVSHKPSSGNLIGYTFRGKTYPCESAHDVLVKVLIHFHSLDPGFMARYAPATKAQTNSPIVLVAQDPGELRDRRGSPCDYENLEIGWCMRKLGSNKKSIRSYITVACKIAGVQFGTDLSVSL